jgi:tRNA dimethylallyltransferase
MLYFRALLEGLSELPPADIGVRMAIDTKAKESGWPEMHKELQQLDPAIAMRIQPNDSQRIQRALEIYYLTDKPMSELLKKPRYVYLPYRVSSIALIPDDRDVLHQRIAHRFEEMLELGLISEVRAVRDKFGLEAETPSMRCVGYRQAWMYLDNEISLTEMREMGLAATRQLAKRQLTWLRSMKGFKEFNCFAENLPQLILEYLQENESMSVAHSKSGPQKHTG